MLSKIYKFFKSNLFFFIILTGVVFTVYGHNINFQLTNLDDDYLVQNNITYISKIQNIPNFFTESCYYSKEFPYYRPVLSISFAAEAILFGYNLKVSHTANIIYFILSIFCIFLLVAQLRFNTSAAKFICLLLAVHPILMSCPAWIPARNDTLLVIFFTLTLTSFLKFIETNKKKDLFFFIFFFILSIFTKETALVLLPIFPLTLYCFNYKISKQQLFKISSILLPMLAVYFILRTISITTVELSSYLTNFKESAGVIITGLLTYTTKFIIPDYIPVMLYKIQLTPKLLTVNIVLLLLIMIVWFTRFINRKVILFSGTWFILSLLPTFFIPDYLLLFHRFVIPAVAVVILLSELTGKIIIKYPFAKKYLFFLFISLFVVFSLTANIYSNRYKNAESFWTNAYTDAPNYPENLHGLAKVLIAQEKYQKAKDLIYEAMKYKYYNYIPTLCNILFLEKKYDEAETIFLEALKTNHENYILHQYYINLSNIYLHKMDFKKSVEFAEKSLELSPYNTNSFKMLAKFYAVTGEYKKAIEILLNLLKSDKGNIEYLENLALLYADFNDKNNAVKYVNEILKFEPANKIAIDVLKKAGS
ncbi:MAG: glycosyltransferase family 39 protein [Endomicrobiaceae bacterium]|jgi:tetratricopeptide (TPR) repeat protein|nr:glycosyltransferase family 39 protein [Endomicrobiaceae bacterium]MDD4166136.1 glycosyltransferase family 39 protein [Endomicrobiaceae bacterium]